MKRPWWLARRGEPQHGLVETAGSESFGLRSLAGHAGLDYGDVLKLSEQGRLAEIFDPKTRKIKSRRQIRRLRAELRRGD